MLIEQISANPSAFALVAAVCRRMFPSPMAKGPLVVAVDLPEPKGSFSPATLE